MSKELRLNDFNTLKVYQMSLDLVEDIYKIKNKFPKEETYAMVSQITRAVTSISANIAEGNSAIYLKSEISFLSNSRGSCGEVECFLAISRRVGYITKEEYEVLVAKTITLKKMISVYIKKLNQI